MEIKEINFILILEVDNFGIANIKTQNNGVSEELLVAYLDTWIELVKDNMKDRIRNNFFSE